MIPYLVLCGSAIAAPIVLVKDGRPAALIVVNYNADNDGQFRAALALREYIEKMSGARLAVSPGGGYPGGAVLFVGKHFRTEQLAGDVLDEQHLGRSGYLIRTSGSHICRTAQTVAIFHGSAERGREERVLQDGLRRFQMEAA